MEDYQTSIGVILKMGASAEAAAEVPGLLDFPDMLGESDKIDVTTMKDTQRKYKPGLSDPGDMAFTFGYEGMKTGTNWATLKGAKDADKTFILLFAGRRFHMDRQSVTFDARKGRRRGADLYCKNHSIVGYRGIYLVRRLKNTSAGETPPKI